MLTPWGRLFGVQALACSGFSAALKAELHACTVGPLVWSSGFSLLRVQCSLKAELHARTVGPLVWSSGFSLLRFSAA